MIIILILPIQDKIYIIKWLIKVQFNNVRSFNNKYYTILIKI